MADGYRAVQVSGARNFRLVERELREPGFGHVRIRVEACGVCHTDVLGVEGLRADPSAPVVPGHEVVGVIDAVGPGVHAWEIGERVGVGFLYGHCGECERCRRGDFVNCLYQPQTGSDIDGGYAESMIAKAAGLVRIPDGISAVEAAPLLCAGLTTFMGLSGIKAAPGELVAVQGIGGLGHLALQYASRLGYEVAAIARGTGKEELARKLGADHYIDSESEDPGRALAALGGAAGVIATATTGASMSPLVPGLKQHGTLMVLGAAQDPVLVQATDLIFGARTVRGRLTGTSADNEDNLRFSLRRGVRSMNEVVPLSEAPAAYERMLSGKARFRVVLDATA
ncbi:alcohol dehydrogenase catalytic domain-containing protein [Streptomyces sp. NBC_01497]|uniref:alcohol dehydrogenase catalytic domain-containing protein n=1 Tax=Streptomyces sp. NBC_01497 TaxID=2903885 RepID=UPI002E36C896|nr:alcohol dehydrogenase catalytic domain-containing protein [Streptomyces sp. NBC_01497]